MVKISNKALTTKDWTKSNLKSIERTLQNQFIQKIAKIALPSRTAGNWWSSFCKLLNELILSNTFLKKRTLVRIEFFWPFLCQCNMYFIDLSYKFDFSLIQIIYFDNWKKVTQLIKNNWSKTLLSFTISNLELFKDYSHNIG